MLMADPGMAAWGLLMAWTASISWLRVIWACQTQTLLNSNARNELICSTQTLVITSLKEPPEIKK